MEQKQLSTEKNKLTEMIENVENGIEKMKKDKLFAIGQKIPSYVKPFTKNDMREKKLKVKNSAILRILTKWAENLEKIFEDPETFIRNRVYPFNTTSNELVNPTKSIKDKMLKRMSTLK